METKIVVTVLEMLRDRGYDFGGVSRGSGKWGPDRVLREIRIEDYVDQPNKHKKAIEEYREELRSVPYVGSVGDKLKDKGDLPLDGSGVPVYVFVQDGDETVAPYADNQPDRLGMAKQIVANLKGAFPEVSGIKRLEEIWEHLHLIIVFNGIKKELIKLEELSFRESNFEAFPKYRLRYNVTKHNLQGVYRKLNKEESDRYKEVYQASLGTIQIYRIDDPIVRYYHGQPGDIFHIIRARGGENYRIVVRKTMGK